MDLSIDTATLWAFTLLWLVIVPTPGANSLLITHIAVTRTMRDVLVAVAGNMAGICLLALAALLGWAAALSAFPWLRIAVSVLGGGYLIYFGCRLAWAARARKTDRTTPQHPEYADHRVFSLGFVTALSNAHAILFITGIYAATGILEANLATGLASIAVMIVCNASYLALLGLVFRLPAIRDVYNRYRPVLEYAIAALFAVLGGRLMLRAADAAA